MAPIPNTIRETLELARDMAARYMDTTDEELQVRDGELFAMCYVILEECADAVAAGRLPSPEHIQGTAYIIYMMGKEDGRREVVA